jgi:hypothetical protein
VTGIHVCSVSRLVRLLHHHMIGLDIVVSPLPLSDLLLLLLFQQQQRQLTNRVRSKVDFFVHNCASRSESKFSPVLVEEDPLFG